MTDGAMASPIPEAARRPTVVVFDPIPGDWSWDPETAILGTPRRRPRRPGRPRRMPIGRSAPRTR